jgi:hypothetical protein
VFVEANFGGERRAVVGAEVCDGCGEFAGVTHLFVAAGGEEESGSDKEEPGLEHGALRERGRRETPRAELSFAPVAFGCQTKSMQRRCDAEGGAA